MPIRKNLPSLRVRIADVHAKEEEDVKELRVIESKCSEIRK